MSYKKALLEKLAKITYVEIEGVFSFDGESNPPLVEVRNVKEFVKLIEAYDVKVVFVLKSAPFISLLGNRDAFLFFKDGVGYFIEATGYSTIQDMLGIKNFDKIVSKMKKSEMKDERVSEEYVSDEDMGDIYDLRSVRLQSIADIGVKHVDEEYSKTSKSKKTTKKRKKKS